MLSDKSVESLFKGTLDPRAYDGIAVMMSKIRGFGGEDGLNAGEADWTTGMALFLPDESRTSEAMSSGRKSGSVGWGGAAGTEYWIDPASGIAVSLRATILQITLCKGGRTLSTHTRRTDNIGVLHYSSDRR